MNLFPSFCVEVDYSILENGQFAGVNNKDSGTKIYQVRNEYLRNNSAPKRRLVNKISNKKKYKNVCAVRGSSVRLRAQKEDQRIKGAGDRVNFVTVGVHLDADENNLHRLYAVQMLEAEKDEA